MGGGPGWAEEEIQIQHRRGRCQAIRESTQFGISRYHHTENMMIGPFKAGMGR
jgi:hypothetical protein